MEGIHELGLSTHKAAEPKPKRGHLPQDNLKQWEYSETPRLSPVFDVPLFSPLLDLSAIRGCFQHMLGVNRVPAETQTGVQQPSRKSGGPGLSVS